MPTFTFLLFDHLVKSISESYSQEASDTWSGIFLNIIQNSRVKADVARHE